MPCTVRTATEASWSTAAIIPTTLSQLDPFRGWTHHQDNVRLSHAPESVQHTGQRDGASQAGGALRFASVMDALRCPRVPVRGQEQAEVGPCDVLRWGELQADVVVGNPQVLHTAHTHTHGAHMQGRKAGRQPKPGRLQAKRSPGVTHTCTSSHGG